MATSESQDDRDRDRRRRELLMFLLMLLLGFACLLITAQIAIRPTGVWQVQANMLSELNPDAGLAVWEVYVEPLRPEVMTRQPWDPSLILTPIGDIVIVPPVVFIPAPTGTATPGAVAIVPTPYPSPTPTSSPPTRAPARTPTSRPPPPTDTPIPSTPTGTHIPPTPTGTSVLPTSTPPMPKPTSVPPPPTDTPIPPPPTDTPVPPTPTDTPVPPTPTPTPTDTSTPTNTPTPTDTPSPTPTPDDPPAPPTNLRAAAGDSQIILGWDPNSEPDLAGYWVYSSTVDIAPYALVTATTDTHYLDLSVTNAITYYYYVTAFDAASNASGPSNIAWERPYDITPYTYTTDVDCLSTIPVTDCLDAAGPPDDQSLNITGTQVITLNFGVGTGIIDLPGPDMVFYEWPNPAIPAPGGIYLDYVTIELSWDGTNWYTVFEWNGDGPDTTDVAGTNIDGYATDTAPPYPGEWENEEISSDDLYPGGLAVNTGITIDIHDRTPPGYSFHLVRISYPAGGTDVGQIDAVQRLH